MKKLRVLIAYNEPVHPSSSEDLDFISEAAVKDEAEAVYRATLELGHEAAYLAVQDVDGTLQNIREYQPQLIFNLCEGFQGLARYEMYVAGLWELLHIPYTGNAPGTLGLAQDKVLAKSLFEVNGIPTPDYQVYAETPNETHLHYPLIAKPAREDASLGITQRSIVKNFQDLKTVVDELLNKYRQPILVEQFISGREFNISMLGNDPPQTLPISEIVFHDLGEGLSHITSYEAKWLPDHPLYQKTPSVCPAEIDEDLSDRLHEIARRVYAVLRGRDYGRIDTRVDEHGRIYVLEYNPNPDISPDAGFAKALRAAGIEFVEFVKVLINQAMHRNMYD